MQPSLTKRPKRKKNSVTGHHIDFDIGKFSAAYRPTASHAYLSRSINTSKGHQAGAGNRIDVAVALA